MFALLSMSAKFRLLVNDELERLHVGFGSRVFPHESFANRLEALACWAFGWCAFHDIFRYACYPGRFCTFD